MTWPSKIHVLIHAATFPIKGPETVIKPYGYTMKKIPRENVPMESLGDPEFVARFRKDKAWNKWLKQTPVIPGNHRGS